MTDKEVAMTLSLLKGAIFGVREKGENIDSIRIGISLYDAIVAYNISLILHYRKSCGALRTIYGVPVKVDYENPWVLKVMTAVDVPVLRESEGSGIERDSKGVS